MSRRFKTADYDATLDVTVRLGDCLPPDHLARFVVDTIAQLDLAADNIRVVLFHPGQTATELGNNALYDGNRDFHPPQPDTGSAHQFDSAEAVARNILEAAITEPAEMEMPTRG